MLAVSVPALSLKLACAVCFVASDYFRKVATESIPPVTLLTIFVTGQEPLLGAWLLLSESFNVLPGYWSYGLATALASLLANLFFIMAMHASSLSLTVPVLALIPVFTTVLAAITLNEISSGQQLAGIVLSVAGLMWLYMPEDNPKVGAVLKRFITDKGGGRYMLLVAVLWSATAPLDKTSVQLSSGATHAFVKVCLISGVMIVYVFAAKKNRHVRYHSSCDRSGSFGVIDRWNCLWLSAGGLSTDVDRRSRILEKGYRFTVRTLFGLATA